MKSTITKLLLMIVLFYLSPQLPVPVHKEPRHQVKFENQYVRVLDVNFPPGYTTLFHTHANDNVAIAISGGKLRSERVGEQPGDTISVTGRAGFAKASYTHRITNTGDAALRFIDVEILSTPSLSKNTLARDKVPGHQMVLENEQVRIYRIKLEPGQSTEAFTYELSGLTVVVSPAKVQLETPKQKTQTEDFKPGAFRWHEGSRKQTLKNIGPTSFEAIDIELK